MNTSPSGFGWVQKSVRCSGAGLLTLALAIGSAGAALEASGLTRGESENAWRGPGAEGAEQTVPALVTRAVELQYFRDSVPYGETIHRTAARHGVDPMLVAAIIETESGFNRNRRSPEGARGLMQIRSATGRAMGHERLEDPVQNIEAGTKYLVYLRGRFGEDRARILAAYNAGEGVVRRYGGVPPYPETRSYIARVTGARERRHAELLRFAERNSRTAWNVVD